MAALSNDFNEKDSVSSEIHSMSNSEFSFGSIYYEVELLYVPLLVSYILLSNTCSVNLKQAGEGKS